MPELLLIRHAKSDWHTHAADIDRPLNGRGKKDAVKIGRALVELDCVPDRIVTSPAQRTRETIERMSREWDFDRNQITVDDELYMAGGETIIELAATYLSSCERLMIVAHNPGMDAAVSYLVSKPPALSISGKLMVTAAAAHFFIPDISDMERRGGCELSRLLRPREMA